MFQKTNNKQSGSKSIVDLSKYNGGSIKLQKYKSPYNSKDELKSIERIRKLQQTTYRDERGMPRYKFGQFIDGKFVCNYTIDEIEQIIEEEKIKQREELYAAIEFKQYFWVAELNQLYNKIGPLKFQNTILSWEVKSNIEGDEIEDEVLIEIKQYLEDVGAVKFIKAINNQYLKYCIDCQNKTRSRIKQTNWKHLMKLRNKSNKDVEKEQYIAEQINYFVNKFNIIID